MLPADGTHKATPSRNARRKKVKRQLRRSGAAAGSKAAQPSQAAGGPLTRSNGTAPMQLNDSVKHAEGHRPNGTAPLPAELMPTAAAQAQLQVQATAVAPNKQVWHSESDSSSDGSSDDSASSSAANQPGESSSSSSSDSSSGGSSGESAKEGRSAQHAGHGTAQNGNVKTAEHANGGKQADTGSKAKLPTKAETEHLPPLQPAGTSHHAKLVKSAFTLLWRPKSVDHSRGAFQRFVQRTTATQ